MSDRTGGPVLTGYAAVPTERRKKLANCTAQSTAPNFNILPVARGVRLVGAESGRPQLGAGVVQTAKPRQLTIARAPDSRAPPAAAVDWGRRGLRRSGDRRQPR